MPQLAAWRSRAESGDPLAQLVLANAYLTGRFAPQSFTEALRWLEAACAHNDPEALLYHAALAALGLGRRQDLSEAHDLVKRAAKAGSARAEAQLAALSDADGRFRIGDWSTPIEGVQYFRAPRIFTISNFIPKAACAWLIEETRALQQPALVLNKREGVAVRSTRTNSSATIDPLQTDLVVQLVNARIAQAVGLPTTHQEPTNVLYYKTGEEYKPHYDFLTGALIEMRAEEIAELGQRVATLLIYLNEDYEGGETAFPGLGWRYKGKTGDALLFWNVTPDGELDYGSRHAGLPVRSGEKWLLSKWVRAKPIPLGHDLLWGEDASV